MQEQSLKELLELKWREEVLRLSNKHLTHVPAVICSFPNLTNLYLTNNSIEYLPEEFSNLQKLEVLDLSNNLLNGFPKEILKLKNLRQLNLSYNNLFAIPKEINQLQNLESLILFNCNINSIPRQLLEIRALSFFNIEQNPIEIPDEIKARKSEPKNIVKFFIELQIGQSTPINEAKVLVVGQGGIGKTSLIKRLIKNRFNSNENKTNGIDIHEWKVKGGLKQRDIKLNIWDFGGQEILHSTHQFFLTKRSIYLIVVDSRQGEAESKLEYWIQLVRSFGGESPIIIVNNKSDQHASNLDWNKLKRKYSSIKDIIKCVSCKTGEGIAEVKKSIFRELNYLEHMNDRVPKSWQTVKKRLEKMEQDYISYDQYLSICIENNIMDGDSQKTLIDFLHDLGIVLHFTELPLMADTNILNPEWVTQAVYHILGSNHLQQKNGVLMLEDLSKILNSKFYPPSMHLVIIDLMRKFELCFDYEGFANKKFLIPELLQVEEPPFPEQYNGILFQYHYNFLPKSIILRFIVRMNIYIFNNMVWRSGVMLISEKGDNTAIIQADYEDKIISVSVTGSRNKTSKNFLDLIRADFRKIHEDIPELFVKKKVPIKNGIVVDYQYLLDLEEMGETEFVPEGMKIKVNINDLLNGVDSEDTRPQARSNIFISYSRSDLKWLTEIKNALVPIARNRNIDLWDDSKIRAGDNWKEEIINALDMANVAILLVSHNFLASDFIAEHELLPLLRASKEENLKILWIPVGASSYTETAIADYQPVIDPQIPLNTMEKGDLDKALLKIANAVKDDDTKN